MTCATDPTSIVKGSSNNSSPRLRGAASADGVAPSIPNSRVDLPNAIPVEEEVLMETSSGGSYCVAQHIQNHAIGRCYSSYQPATDDYTGNQGSKWAEILWRRGRVLSQYGSVSSAQWQQLGLWCAANCHARLLGSSVGNSSESNAAIPVEEEVLMETSSGGSYCVAQHIQNHAIGRCYGSYQPAADDYTGNHGSKWAEILWRRGRVLSHYGSMSSAQWQQLGLWCAANCQPRLLGSSVGNSSESNAAIPVEEEVLMETSSGGSYCAAQHIQNHAIGRCYSSYQPA